MFKVFLNPEYIWSTWDLLSQWAVKPQTSEPIGWGKGYL